MIRWQFPATNNAIRTAVGDKVADVIRLSSREGCGLFGPYLDLPEGACTARIIFAGRHEGHVAMDIAANNGQMVVASRSLNLAEVEGQVLELSTEIPDRLSACEIRLHCDSDVCADISAVEIDLDPPVSIALRPDRPVGHESRKTYAEKIANGFFAKYLSGEAILEIGYKGYVDGTVPIVPQAIGIDVDYPGYDGVQLPFPDESQDAVYSSHCFEHIQEYQAVLREWYRVLKVGGYLIIVVPHQHLFERRRHLPSRGNIDHKRFYTPASLLREIEEVFPPNTYRIRHLMDNDTGFDYSVTPREPGVGCYEIELVLEKRKKPAWELDDATSRGYNAVEFESYIGRPTPWSLETDFSVTDACVIFGPYVSLAAGEYEVKYLFEAIHLDDQSLASEITLDIAQNTKRIASMSLAGADGARILREGSATLRFCNSIPGAYFEFRVFTTGRPFRGKFRFGGVFLNAVWRSE
jgi:SAM-dependent methyltransferase